MSRLEKCFAVEQYEDNPGRVRLAPKLRRAAPVVPTYDFKTFERGSKRSLDRLCLFDSGFWDLRINPRERVVCAFTGPRYEKRFSRSEFERARVLLARWKRFKHYVTEIAPGWHEVDRINYADNSTEAIQEDKDGNRRRIMIEAPHGDLCY